MKLAEDLDDNRTIIKLTDSVIGGITSTSEDREIIQRDPRRLEIWAENNEIRQEMCK